MIPTYKEHQISVIYKITNIVNESIYIGSATNFYKRYASYKSLARPETPERRPMALAIRKYGFEKFVFEIIETVSDKSNLIAREQYWLDTLTPWKRSVGYNVNKIANSPLGTRHFRKGKSAKAVLQIDPKTLQIKDEFLSIGDAARKVGGQPCGISSVCKGRRNSIYGYHWRFKSEYNAQTFEPRQDHRISSASCYLNVKPIEQLDKDGNLLAKWSCAKEIANKLGFAATCVLRVCRGERSHSYGYLWRFSNDQSEIDRIRAAFKSVYKQRFSDAHAG